MIQETNKELLFGDTAKERIIKGINIVADAVKTTLGPGGQTVIIETQNGPHITKDGVTVAKNIKLKDNFENLGAQLCKEIALKTVTEAGDGTSSSLVIAQALIKYGLELLDIGVSPIALKREIDEVVQSVIQYVKDSSIPITSTELLKSVATISANNDSVIGELIANAFDKIGNEGVITVEESKDSNTTIDIIQGMQFDRGLLAPHFATDTVKNECVLIDPYILITEQRIITMRSLVQILEPMVKEGNSLLLIAEDFDNEVIDNLKLNKLQGVLKVCPIKAPSFGDFRKEILHDLAALTGGENVSYDSNLSLKDVNIAMLGKCEKVVVTKDHCTIIGGKGDNEHIQHRIEKIRNQITTSEAESVIENCKLRLAKLTGGIAQINVGGSTEIEMRERKDRIDDAVCATRAAIEEGVVIGGGQLLYKYGVTKLDIENYIKAGETVVYSAIQTPFEQILTNSGYEGDLSITDRVINENIGFNAKNGEFCDLFENGIIDPTKVVRLTLENAASIAGLVLSTNCVIANEQINIISL